MPPAKNLTQASQYNVELGLTYLAQGNLQRAQYKLVRATEQDPDSAAAYSALGYFYASTGEPEPARVAYLRSLTLAPRSGEMYNNYGVFLCQQAEYEDSRGRVCQSSKAA